MHYYDTAGNSANEVQGKNGKLRTPYWHEAKALGLVPGTTSMNAQLASEAIVFWKVNLALELAKRYPFDTMTMNEDVWKDKIRAALKLESTRIQKQGHGIHDALDKYYKTGILNETWKDYIVPVIEMIASKWPMLVRTDWIAEKRFNYKGLYGGSVDLHCEYEDGIILDYKSKDTTDKSKFKTYEGHHQQLVAYAHGLGMPNAICGNILLSALEPGILVFIQHYEAELTKAWEGFKLLVQYWHLQNFRQGISFTEDK